MEETRPASIQLHVRGESVTTDSFSGNDKALIILTNMFLSSDPNWSSEKLQEFSLFLLTVI